MLRGRPFFTHRYPSPTFHRATTLALAPYPISALCLRTCRHRGAMVSQPPSTEVGSIFDALEASARVAELETEVAQLKEALERRQQIGVATGLLAQRFNISPDRAWALLVRLSQNGHVKVRDIAQALINAHCGMVGPTEAKIISAIELHLPDGVCLIPDNGDGHHPASQSPSL
jgi:ANTAR domain